MENHNHFLTGKLNYTILLVSMLVGGFLTLLLGKDLNWDLANYHYYNAYALLHNRYDQDFWPAGLNTYFNPTLDLLTYFLINTFPPRLAGFSLGAIQGVTIWLVFRIALLFLQNEKSSVVLALFIAGLGIYCPQFICGIGMSLGDLTVGIFVLGAIYFALSTLSCHPECQASKKKAKNKKNKKGSRRVAWGKIFTPAVYEDVKIFPHDRTRLPDNREPKCLWKPCFLSRRISLRYRDLSRRSFGLKSGPQNDSPFLDTDSVREWNDRKKAWLIFLSGILLGLGIGLKYIIGFYAIGMAAAFLFIPISSKNRFYLIFIWGIALTLGITITAGYWMLFLWFKFHNPLFPFFNALFKSPYFPEINWRDTRFLPKTVWETFFYPFYFSFHGNRTDDIPYKDIRFLIIYVLIVITGVRYLVFKTNIKQWNLAEKWFLFFFIFSFIVWELFSGFMRYAIILQMLSPLIIYLLIEHLCTKNLCKFIGIFAASYSIIFVMTTHAAERGSWNLKDYFGIEMPIEFELPKKAIVVFPIQDYNRFNNPPLSLAYLIPFLPKDWNFIGIPFVMNETNTIPETTKIKISKLKGSFYTLTEDKMTSHFSQLFSPLKLSKKNCVKIRIGKTAYRNTDIYLCKIE